MFETSWDTVYRAVKFVVAYGLNNRDLADITEITVDEISVECLQIALYHELGTLPEAELNHRFC